MNLGLLLQLFQSCRLDIVQRARLQPVPGSGSTIERVSAMTVPVLLSSSLMTALLAVPFVISIRRHRPLLAISAGSNCGELDACVPFHKKASMSP